MEAKLAEYRSRKKAEQQRSQTVSQRIFGVFKRTAVDAPRSGQPDLTSKREEEETVHTENEKQSEQDNTEIPSPPEKRHFLLLTLKISLWLIVWKIFTELQFGAVFFVVSALIFVYFNTRTGKRGQKSLSAYSVFNPNCERLQGTITAEQFESELLHRKPPQSET